MTKVGAYEAKTHLPELLDRVARGERIVITKRGVPVAVLQPPDGSPRRAVREVVAELRRFRKGRDVSREEIRSWIREGRD